MIIVCWTVKVFYAYVFFLRPPTSPKKETIIALISPEGNVVALNKFFDPDVDVSYLERKALWYERTHNIFVSSFSHRKEENEKTSKSRKSVMEEKKFMATSDKVRLMAFYNELAIEVYSSALWNNLTWI